MPTTITNIIVALVDVWPPLFDDGDDDDDQLKEMAN